MSIAPTVLRTIRDDLRRDFAWPRLWSLFDGDATSLNLAHECLDRHADRGDAICLRHADGRFERLGFAELSELTGRAAHWLLGRGVKPGERVAIIAEPSRDFYVGLFGAIKAGAIAVPLFPLFGPEGLRLRVDDCKPALLLTQSRAAELAALFPDVQVVAFDDAFWRAVAAQPAAFRPSTRASDPALFQYTSGTTRALPDAVRHSHRSIVTLMTAALYGVGLEPGDRYFCPSSPAWGHGLAHGTLAPLALGVRTGTVSGKFDAVGVLDALEHFAIDNFAAAPTVFRMIRASGLAGRYRIRLAKCSYSGEPMDEATWDWVAATFGVRPASMYGSTEVGVLIANYPGFADYEIRRATLGKPVPGQQVAIIDGDGRELADGTPGEIAVRRKDGWFRVKDRGWRDADGYFHIQGRSDDVIISAGWTMSAVEIENTLLKMPQIREAAVVGVPDALRGQIPMAFLVAAAGVGEQAVVDFMKNQLSRHEYPRRIRFVDALPKTPAGKVDRRALRSAAAADPARVPTAPDTDRARHRPR